MATKVENLERGLCPGTSSVLSFLINCLCLRVPEASPAGRGVIRFAVWRKDQGGQTEGGTVGREPALATVEGDKGLKWAVAIRREKSR